MMLLNLIHIVKILQAWNDLAGTYWDHSTSNCAYKLYFMKTLVAVCNKACTEIATSGINMQHKRRVTEPLLRSMITKGS
jgi:hypothetical protein